MEPQTNAPTIDDFEEDLIHMKIRGSTQEELLTWLDNRDVIVSERTLRRRLKLWQEEPSSSDSEQLINLIDYLFHTQPTYSDSLISQRLKEDYNLQATARHIKTIRLRNNWLRRCNDLEANQAQQAEITHLIHELLREGQIRQYGRRYLITRLARQHGHRAQGRHVRQALQILDNHNMTQRTPGMQRKRQENYIVPGPDWLWCLDGHDKLARYGIEIYGSVDAYSRKIIWFYVGVSNRTQVSVLHRYLHTIKTLGYCPNYLRTDRGRETPMMADAHYYFYHTACLYDDTISDEAFDNICFADCYLFGKSTSNVKIEGLWGQLIAGQTEQWIALLSKKARS
jgi:hypothetical protein